MMLFSSASDSHTDSEISTAAIISTRKMITMLLQLNSIAASVF